MSWRLAAMLLWTALAAAQTIAVRPGSDPVALNGVWKWHEGDDVAWASPSFDDASWPTVTVPGSPLPHQPGTLWIRIRIAGAPGERVYIGTANLAEAVELYWNGVRAGSLGNFERPSNLVYDVFPRPVMSAPVTFPRAGELILALRLSRPPAHVAAAPTQLADSALFVGSETGVRERIDARFQFPNMPSRELFGFNWGGWYSLVLNASALILGMYLIVAWYSAREVHGLLWLGINCLTYNLAVVVFAWWVEHPVSLDLANRVMSLLMAITLLTTLELSIELAHVRSRWPRWLAYGPSLAGTVWELVYPGRVIPGQSWTIPGIVLVPLFLTLAIVFNLRRRSAWLLVAGLTPFMVLATLQDANGMRSLTGFDNSLLVWERTYDAELNTLVTAGFALFLGLYFQRSVESIRAERQRMSQELTAGSEMQRLLIPGSRQEWPHWTVEAVYRPAGEVGGDFYRFHQRADGSLLVLVGDMSGKGLRPAMIVSFLLGVIEESLHLPPRELLARLNARLQGRVSGGFVTCCAAVFESDGECRVVNAGHVPPWVDGETLEMESAMPLGIVAEWEADEVALSPGSVVTMVSDGIVEAANPRGELFGFDRSRALSMKPAQEIAEAARAWGQNDDITVVTVRRATA